MLTTSVAVQAHRPIRTISMGPAAVLRWRSESITIAWPLLALATKRSPSVHVTCASTFMACLQLNAKIYHTAGRPSPVLKGGNEQFRMQSFDGNQVSTNHPHFPEMNSPAKPLQVCR